MTQMTSLDQTLNSRNRGRPMLSTVERKRARNLSVSDEAWKKLDEQIQNLPVKTASELVEKIGLGQIQLTTAEFSTLGDIPICRRLKALMEKPIAVFGSILAFVRRTCWQFKLEPTDARVYDVTLKASTIVFYTGYTHPDVLINNPSALIKWLCYEILQAEADRQLPKKLPLDCPAVRPSEVEQPEVERIFCQINHAFDRLEMAARSPEYKALKMKTMDGLTIKQISRIFKLQKLEVSKVEVSRMIKRGLVNFRELFYDALEDVSHPIDVAPSERRQWVQQTAQDYLQIALQETLTSGALERLQAILLATSHDPYLDFWLNEIDYYLRDRPPSAKKPNSKMPEPDAAIIDLLAENLEEHLQQKKKEIDRELAFCQTAQQIQQVLETYAEREAIAKLPIKRLIG
jgi:ribosomal protein S15P/S13E